MMNKLKNQQRAQYLQKKQTLNGVRKQQPGALQMSGAMALEDMHLDRKADFEGDAFDPFKIGQKKSAGQHNLLEL